MNKNRPGSVVSPTSMIRIGLLLLISFVFVSGCSSLSKTKRDTKRLYKDASIKTEAYTKTMAVLPFENNVPWAATDMNTSFVPELTDTIEKESRVHILLPNSPAFPAGIVENDMDSFTLATSGRASGVNLILSGRLVGIRHETEDRGFFWFAKIVHLAQVQLEVTVLHTGSGAKLLDKTIFHNIEISETEGELIEAGQMPDTLPLSDGFADMAETLGKMTCSVLKHIPWETYVVSVENGRVVLAAGESCGLKNETVLKVFNMEEVSGEDAGQRFFTVGKEIGLITVTSVSSNRSEADLKDGGPIPPGSMVRTQ